MTTKDILVFAAGIGVGALSAWYGCKEYYRKKSQDDISEMMEFYHNKEIKLTPVTLGPTEDQKQVEEEKKEYEKKIEKLNYSSFSEKEDKKVNGFKPYPITPDEFNDEEEYDKVTYTFFAGDETFMNLDEEVVEEGMDLIGDENLQHFDDYEDDVLFVRNDMYGCVYRVIYDERAFSETEYSE